MQGLSKHHCDCDLSQTPLFLLQLLDRNLGFAVDLLVKCLRWEKPYYASAGTISGRNEPNHQELPSPMNLHARAAVPRVAKYIWGFATLLLAWLQVCPLCSRCGFERALILAPDAASRLVVLFENQVS